MTNEIRQWCEIKDKFTDGLILGNGASISVHQEFGYRNLLAEAKRLGHLTEDAERIFAAFGVNDFELVLRYLWHSKVVSDALRLRGESVDKAIAAYISVRTALIETIREVHISYENATPHFEHIYKFLRGFKTVTSLNYDLIVYWAAQYGNAALNSRYNFKDCFERDRRFPDAWETKREPYGGVTDPTLYFYPHGNLVLVREKDERERKVVVDSNSNLLETIFGLWETGNHVPVFVCEGTSALKKAALDRSTYMGRVYREVIPVLGDSLTIYGWGLGEQEKHITDQILRSPPRRIAISIRNGNKLLMRRAEEIFDGRGLELVYFDSDSPGAWNRPPTDK